MLANGACAKMKFVQQVKYRSGKVFDSEGVLIFLFGFFLVSEERVSQMYLFI